MEIGGCDYCGEFCAEVGLRSVEGFALPSGRVPWSAGPAIILPGRVVISERLERSVLESGDPERS